MVSADGEEPSVDPRSAEEPIWTFHSPSHAGCGEVRDSWLWCGGFPGRVIFSSDGQMGRTCYCEGDSKSHRMNDIRGPIVEDKAETRNTLARMLGHVAGFDRVAACEPGGQAPRRDFLLCGAWATRFGRFLVRCFFFFAREVVGGK